MSLFARGENPQSVRFNFSLCGRLRLKDFYLERGKETERRIYSRNSCANRPLLSKCARQFAENHRPFSEKCVALGKMRHLCFLRRGSPRRNGLSSWSKEILYPRVCRPREFLGRSHALARKLSRGISRRPAARTFEGNIRRGDRREDRKRTYKKISLLRIPHATENRDVDRPLYFTISLQPPCFSWFY